MSEGKGRGYERGWIYVWGRWVGGWEREGVGEGMDGGEGKRGIREV